MIPAERLQRAGELVDQAVAEIEESIPDVEAYAVESLRFLRAELLVAKRRLQNVSRALGSSTRRVS